jgi:hypothetical protein
MPCAGMGAARAVRPHSRGQPRRARNTRATAPLTSPRAGNLPAAARRCSSEQRWGRCVSPLQRAMTPEPPSLAVCGPSACRRCRPMTTGEARTLGSPCCLLWCARSAHRRQGPPAMAARSIEGWRARSGFGAAARASGAALNRAEPIPALTQISRDKTFAAMSGPTPGKTPPLAGGRAEPGMHVPPLCVPRPTRNAACRPCACRAQRGTLRAAPCV